MKLKLSKDREKVIDIIINACLVLAIMSLHLDYFKEVSLLPAIYSSIAALLTIILGIYKGVFKGFKSGKYNMLILFLVSLIVQIVVGKAMLFGIIVNFVCIAAEMSRAGYINLKEEEEEKERRRLE